MEIYTKYAYPTDGISSSSDLYSWQCESASFCVMIHICLLLPSDVMFPFVLLCFACTLLLPRISLLTLRDWIVGLLKGSFTNWLSNTK